MALWRCVIRANTEFDFLIPDTGTVQKELNPNYPDKGQICFSAWASVWAGWQHDSYLKLWLWYWLCQSLKLEEITVNPSWPTVLNLGLPRYQNVSSQRRCQRNLTLLCSHFNTTAKQKHTLLNCSYVFITVLKHNSNVLIIL